MSDSRVVIDTKMNVSGIVKGVRQAVSKWEQDNGYPETEKLIQLAQKLDISLDELLLDKKKQEQPLPVVNALVNSGERKIVFRSVIDSNYNGATMSSFYKFTISPNLFATKKQPKCLLCGVDKKNNFWGDNLVSLAWYATRDGAQREISEIYTAMLNGEVAYELKYYAKVKEKAVLKKS
jgi:transcriptional regulator with XRE-family HTH domain